MALVLTSYPMSTVSFPEIKRPRRIVDYPPLSVAEVKEKVELYIWAFVACSRLHFLYLNIK